jgi:epsilon-lactone hydrolase
MESVMAAHPYEYTPTNVRADSQGNLEIGAQAVPLPTHLSAEAKAAVAGTWAQPYFPTPASSSGRAEWEAWIDAVEDAFVPIVQQILDTSAATVDEQTIDGVHVFRATARSIPAYRKGKALLYVHGGSFVLLSRGGYAKALGALFADQAQCVAYSVNIRTPPAHPFPAALDDVVAVYKYLLKDVGAENIAIMGTSSGGNIAAAATLKIRDSGLPMPAMVILDSPATELEDSGDSMVTNKYLDHTFRGDPRPAVALYLGGHDPKDPYASPLFGDFAKGYPPTLIKTGTRDRLLSSSVLFHRALRRANVEAELHVWEGMSHGGFVPHLNGVPEDMEIVPELRHFLDAHWGR